MPPRSPVGGSGFTYRSPRPQAPYSQFAPWRVRGAFRSRSPDHHTESLTPGAQPVFRAVGPGSALVAPWGHKGLETLEKLGTALDVPLRDFFEGFEEQRGMPPEPLEPAHRLRDVTRSLSDEEVRIALELVEVVAKHRRGQRRGRG